MIKIESSSGINLSSQLGAVGHTIELHIVHLNLLLKVSQNQQRWICQNTA